MITVLAAIGAVAVAAVIGSAAASIVLTAISVLGIEVRSDPWRILLAPSFLRWSLFTGAYDVPERLNGGWTNSRASLNPGAWVWYLWAPWGWVGLQRKGAA